MELFAYDEGLQPLLKKESSIKIVPFSKIALVVSELMKTPEKVLDNQREAFQLLASNEVNICPIQTLGQSPLQNLTSGPNAQVCIKTGYITDGNEFVVKIAGGGGIGQGNTGMMQVYDQKTLKMQCLLQDEGILTEMRTAATASLASQLLAPKNLEYVGLLGASVQAIWQLRFLTCITKTRKVIIRSRTNESALKFREKMKNSSCSLDREWEMETFEEVKNRGVALPFSLCQLIHTCTSSRSPVLLNEEIGTVGSLHITAIGADSPGKQELDLAIIKRAETLVCDLLAQSEERGEFQHVIEENPKVSSTIFEIGSIFNTPELESKLKAEHQSKNCKENDNSSSKLISIFDSSGCAVQDIQITKLISSMIDK